MDAKLDPPPPEAGTKPDGGTRQEAGGSACAAVVDEARALIAECQRTGWQSASCQSIRAEANQCADPSLIRVDPEQGYVCGATADAEAARKAYELLCRRTVRLVPGVPDPCLPPDPRSAGLVFKGPPPQDLCGDPRAQQQGINGGDECFAVYEPASPVPGMTPQQLLVWAQSRFGGPVFVLPSPGGGKGPHCKLVPC